MAFSIPQTIPVTYSLPAKLLENHSLIVGAAIKDMPSGAETSMKKAHAIAVTNAQAKFEIEMANYAAATKKIETAHTAFSEACKKKVLAITVLAMTIIGAVCATVAAVITQTGPFLWVATPFLIGIAPSSYFTHTFREIAAKLEKDIPVTSPIPKPVLHLPLYDPAADLDLKQTRIAAQKTLAKTTLSQIANANYPNENIVNYALLDRVTKISQAKRPAFYAKYLQLIHAQKQIDHERWHYGAQTDKEYRRLIVELHDWVKLQNSYINSQLNVLNAEEKTGTGAMILEPFRNEIAKKRIEIGTTQNLRKLDCASWRQSMIKNINAAYIKAQEHLEKQFTTAIISAA